MLAFLSNSVDHVTVFTAAMTTVVCDTPNKVKSLLSAVGDDKWLQTIVLVDGFTAELKESASKAGIELVEFYDLVVRLPTHH